MANNTLNDFLVHIKKNNIARINRFRISFAMPDKLVQILTKAGTGAVVTGSNKTQATDLSSVQKIVSLTCLITDIPGVQSQTASAAYGSMPRKISFGKSLGDFNTSFIVSGNYTEKKLFDTWQDIIMDDSTMSMEFYDNYISTIVVDCLDGQDTIVYSFELSEAYPVSVSALKLDRTVQNQQMILDVTWSYHNIMVTMDGNITKTKSSKAPGAMSPAAVGKNRLFPIPGLDGFSSSVQSAMSAVKEFRTQLKGALALAADVQSQVRDAKMAVVDGIKTMNGVIKDVKAIAHIPADVKKEVVSVLTDSRNQLGYLKSDVKNIAKYPAR